MICSRCSRKISAAVVRHRFLRLIEPGPFLAASNSFSTRRPRPAPGAIYAALRRDFFVGTERHQPTNPAFSRKLAKRAIEPGSGTLWIVLIVQ